ncbi:MAG: AAA family ATPase [Gammaproteobacteria bacterium]|nr:AAA family ATPase [Gammaproteobacteria bacterium]MBU2185225.1 AAA family ATPase [Gammaproteobacteria bacterium]MBU2206288.1 AAA family ATPase [Gammaproteobacteria bacterium]
MNFNFKIVKYGESSPATGNYVAYLLENNWDDYSFKTTFFLVVFDEFGKRHEIGNLKIGMLDFQIGWISEKFPESFTHFNDVAFSLGQDIDYYKNIRDFLSESLGNQILEKLNDIAYSQKNFDIASEERVFKESLLRFVSTSVIRGQFTRIIKGERPLTEFNFSYKKQKTEKSAQINLNFRVIPNTVPPTNIHVLIGRNGVGKTTLLNNIVKSVINEVSDKQEVGEVLCDQGVYEHSLPEGYFSSISSVSFSAFDPFNPPRNRPDRSLGTCYFYIGLKKNCDNQTTNELKNIEMLRESFIDSLSACFALESKKNRWLKAIKTLESDDNFAEMDLTRLGSLERISEVQKSANNLVKRMSSGHTIVLLTITNLIETVEEKTLVLIDEPESHLHPPLLSAFMRALSDLLVDRNAVSIIATHSPVVLQEVPKSCVWKLERTRNEGIAYRPESETFGENVGILTREVFGLEVTKSGFHAVLAESVNEGYSFDDIMSSYKNQLGFEGQAILRALLANKEASDESN